MSNFFKNIGSKLHDLVYSSNKRTLTPEEAEKAAQSAKLALQRMNENLAWSQIQVNSEIEMIRMLPEGDPRVKQHRRKLKLRLVMQQYMEKMSLALETINSQVELAELSAEVGKSLQGATQLVNSYKRDMPSFTGLVRNFMRSIAPMNEALDGGLDEMTEALDQLCGCTLDGVYNEADLDALIAGQVASINPVVPAKPVETRPAAAPGAAADPMEDMLSSVERTLPSLDKYKN